jgi:NAD+ kinase
VKIAINGRPFDKESLPFIFEFFHELKKYSAEVYIQEAFRDQSLENRIDIGEHKVFSNLYGLPEVDSVISVGGDGTLLETVTYVRDSGIPIFGINTGRMGYLATTKKEDFKGALESVMKGDCPVEERSLVSIGTENEKLFGKINFALNEVAILKRDTSSMIVARAFVNGDFLTSYWGDGVLVSTPTGSTGYSLSCGGPLVLPHSDNLIITPICPHNLNLRPLIVPDDSVIDFEIEGRTNNFLISLDSRSVSVENNIKLRIRKADFRINLYAPEGINHFNTLREKLLWGRDIRN